MSFSSVRDKQNEVGVRKAGLIFTVIGMSRNLIPYVSLLSNVVEYFLNEEPCHKYVNYDHPGECTPEKDCLRVTLTDISTT